MSLKVIGITGVVFFLLTGPLFLGLSIGLKENSCEDMMYASGITVGVFRILILGAFSLMLVAIRKESPSATFIMDVVTWILLVINFGLTIWNMTELLIKNGLQCAAATDSSMWISQLVLNVLFIMYCGFYMGAIITHQEYIIH